MTQQVTAQPGQRTGRDIDATARRLRRLVGGTTYLPGDGGYDAQRAPLFPTMDPRPALVVEAAGADDVRTAVLAARDLDLPLAVQATGHGTHVPSDGGLLLKTTRMAAVLVDPDRRVARVGPGARWSEVIAAAAPFGLSPLSGSAPSVGVAGYTLGGGVGWLARKYGFAADSLTRAEVVTADGERLVASAESNPDLFWALRGGGANFGIVTSMELRLYPVSRVYAGTAVFAIDRAAETLGRYADWAAQAPDELSTAAIVRRMPDTADVPEPVRGRPVLSIRGMYVGSAEEAERWLRPLRASAGPALVDDFRETSYADGSVGGVPPRHLDLFRSLPDPVIDSLIGAVEDPDSPVSTVEIRHWGGAMASPGPDAGPVGHRDVPFSVIADAQPDELVDAMRPHATGGSFLNFLGDSRKTETAFTAENYRRLRIVKRAYDPDNVFRLNHNIPPAATSRDR